MIKFFKQLLSGGKIAKDGDYVCSFNEQHAQEEDVEFIDHGEITVLLENIIGSVGKYHDFDSRFRPKKHAAGRRFQEIRKVMRNGGKLPPVSLYQIRSDFYVLDGNHRVAAAKELGWTDIRAKVVELLSHKNTIENLLYIEKKQFCEKTCLGGNIELTEVGKYHYLENQIRKHQVYLSSQSGKDCDFLKAAKDWYHTIYTPLETIIKTAGLSKYFPHRTLSDLYTYITFHQWERESGRRYGIGIDQMVPRSMEKFRQQMLEKSTPEYPEMKRTITAFILINTSTSAEMKVLDILFEFDEIKEVHSVNGSLDILVKMVLKRDLLASDAEIISEFVEHHIRRIDGINRTETVIPGRSLVKEEFY